MRVITAQAGIAQEEILFIWASVPCTTLGSIDSSNQRPGYTWHRDRSEHSQKRCKCGAVAVTGGTREPRTPRTTSHDRVIGAGSGDGTRCAVQPVRCALRNRESSSEFEDVPIDVVTGAARECAVGTGKLLPVQPHLREGDQCLDDCGLDPKGGSGTGLCRAVTVYCNSKTGFNKEETCRWNHYYVIAGDHNRSVKVSVVVKDELQNKVPTKFLVEIIATLRDRRLVLLLY